MLNFPVPGATNILDTDASDRGIGAVLSQLVPIESTPEGTPQLEERVLGYASRTLSQHERNYCTTRKELLAIVWYLPHFRPYLYGTEFLIRSDHSSLQWIFNFWEPEGQLAHWLQVPGNTNFTSSIAQVANTKARMGSVDKDHADSVSESSMFRHRKQL